MPRNAAGVYTLPDPPRVPNTTIDSPDENVTRDDIGAELTNSLDRNGRGGMLAPFRIADGTVAAPGLGFLNDPDNGLYRIGVDDWAVTCQGQKVMEFTPNTVTIPAGVTMNILGSFASAAGAFVVGGPLVVSNGIIHTGNPVSMFLGTNGTIGLEILHVGAPVNWLQVIPSTAGSAVVLRPVGASATIPLAIGGKGASSVDIYADSVGPLVVRVLPSAGPNALTLTGGVNPTISTTAGNLAITPFTQFGSNVSVPPLSNVFLDGGGDTFISESAANVMRFTCGGTAGLTLTGLLGQFNGNVSINSGNVLFLDGGGNTFIRETPADTIELTAGGTARLAIGANALFNCSVNVVAGAEFNLLGGAGTNFGRMSYSTGGNTSLNIDNGFDSNMAEIRLRTRTTAVTANVLILRSLQSVLSSGLVMSTLAGAGDRFVKVDLNGTFFAA